jgi:hypothetical protein
MESAVTAPVSGHIKRVVVQEGGLWRWIIPDFKKLTSFSFSGDSINQGDLTVEIMH